MLPRKNGHTEITQQLCKIESWVWSQKLSFGGQRIIKSYRIDAKKFQKPHKYNMAAKN